MGLNVLISSNVDASTLLSLSPFYALAHSLNMWLRGAHIQAHTHTLYKVASSSHFTKLPLLLLRIPIILRVC